MSEPVNITFNIDDLADCKRAIYKLGNAIQRRHGQEMAQQIFTSCAWVSPRSMQLAKNIRLLAVQRRSAWGVDKTAAYIAEKNKTLPPEDRFGPTGSTSPSTIAKQIRRLLKDSYLCKRADNYIKTLPRTSPA